MLIHLLLNFTQQYAANEPAYLRVLGFNHTGQKILKEMQRQQLSLQAQQMLALDCRATNLYYLGYALPFLRKSNLDLLQSPVQV